MMTGSAAPTSVPKTASRINIAIGRLITSARKRSSSIATLNSCWTSGMPVTIVSTPAGASDQAGEMLGVVDRLLDLLVETDERERLRAVAADEGRVADVGVREDVARRSGRPRSPPPSRRRIAWNSGEAASPSGSVEDHDQGGGLLAETIGDEGLRTSGIRAVDLPAALAQVISRRRGPDVEADDERDPGDRQPATVADRWNDRARRRCRCGRYDRRAVVGAPARPRRPVRARAQVARGSPAAGRVAHGRREWQGGRRQRPPGWLRG